MRFPPRPGRLAVRLLLLRWFGSHQTGNLRDGLAPTYKEVRDGRPRESEDIDANEVSQSQLQGDNPASEQRADKPKLAPLNLTCRDIQDEVWQRLGW